MATSSAELGAASVEFSFPDKFCTPPLCHTIHLLACLVTAQRNLDTLLQSVVFRAISGHGTVAFSDVVLWFKRTVGEATPG